MGRDDYAREGPRQHPELPASKARRFTLRYIPEGMAPIQRLTAGVNQLNLIEATSADSLAHFQLRASSPESVLSLVDVPLLVSASWPP